MNYLQADDFSACDTLLRKAEVLSQYDLTQRASTLGNFGCYFRRRGKLLMALESLEEAAGIENQLQLDGKAPEKAADTRLNLCAVLSQLGRHGEALEHAQSALIQLQEELLPIPESESEQRLDRISVLCIAYYNAGVEQEFLKKLLQAHKTYVTGYEYAEKYLGPSHSIAATFRGSLRTLGKKLDNQMVKEEKEEEKRRIAKMTPAEFGRSQMPGGRKKHRR
jgi:tetratricopeptide (TPR) repeat protein